MLPNITDEAVQDFQALLAGLTTAEFKDMLQRTIVAANATSLSLIKEVKCDAAGKLVLDENERPQMAFCIRFNRLDDTEYFLQPDPKDKDA